MRRCVGPLHSSSAFNRDRSPPPFIRGQIGRQLSQGGDGTYQHRERCFERCDTRQIGRPDSRSPSRPRSNRDSGPSLLSRGGQSRGGGSGGHSYYDERDEHHGKRFKSWEEEPRAHSRSRSYQLWNWRACRMASRNWRSRSSLSARPIPRGTLSVKAKGAPACS